MNLKTHRLLLILFTVNISNRINILNKIHRAPDITSAVNTKSRYCWLRLDTNYYGKEQILEVSFSQSSFFDDKYGSRLIATGRSMSFRSCFSDFKSVESFHTAFEVQPQASSQSVGFDDIGPREVLRRIDDGINLEEISKFSIENAMDWLLEAIKNTLKYYECESSDLKSILSVYSQDKIKYSMQIVSVENEISELHRALSLRLEKYNGYMLELFAHMLQTKISSFKSASKQFQKGTHEQKIRYVRRKISFYRELISTLSASFTYYMCDNAFLSHLGLCQYIECQLSEAQKRESRLIVKHGNLITSYEPRMQQELSRKGSASDVTQQEAASSSGSRASVRKRFSRVFSKSKSTKKKHK